MKRWVLGRENIDKNITIDQIIEILLEIRGIRSMEEVNDFLHPKDPFALTSQDLGIDDKSLGLGLERIKEALKNRESIVVYADYDADGVTAGAVLWETLHKMGARVMPYIPHRVEEGYGLSVKGIDAVKKEFDPGLILTVDHGITGWEKVEYAKSLGIDVIVTDHHTKPEKLPRCITIHTTATSGAGVSWFLSKELLSQLHTSRSSLHVSDLLALASIGIIADLIPLVGVNRLMVKEGLSAIRTSTRVGLKALISDAGLMQDTVGTFEISHMIAPRLNAMGRLEHALDALRLLCTGQEDKAMLLARKLGLTNKERQKMTEETMLHALGMIGEGTPEKKLLFIFDASYNPGVIGLVAGKLVETYYRPSIVVSVGPEVSKASARSISGFNIVEAIRSCSDILVDVGGHPMAAGFTVETTRLGELKQRLEDLAHTALDDEKLVRTLRVDMELPIVRATSELWDALRLLEPFGFGNYQPVFVSRGVRILDARLVGANANHLKLKIDTSVNEMDAIGFSMGDLYGSLRRDAPVDIAYNLDVNTWNGRTSTQLKLKDLKMIS